MPICQTDKIDKLQSMFMRMYQYVEEIDSFNHFSKLLYFNYFIRRNKKMFWPTVFHT